MERVAVEGSFGLAVESLAVTIQQARDESVKAGLLTLIVAHIAEGMCSVRLLHVRADDVVEMEPTPSLVALAVDWARQHIVDQIENASGFQLAVSEDGVFEIEVLRYSGVPDFDRAKRASPFRQSGG